MIIQDFPRFSRIFSRYSTILIHDFSLSPKCYMAICHDTNNEKRSSKGVQARVVLKYEDYKKAVYDSKIMNVDNVSIRLHNNQMKS